MSATIESTKDIINLIKNNYKLNFSLKVYSAAEAGISILEALEYYPEVSALSIAFDSENNEIMARLSTATTADGNELHSDEFDELYNNILNSDITEEQYNDLYSFSPHKRGISVKNIEPFLISNLSDLEILAGAIKEKA